MTDFLQEAEQFIETDIIQPVEGFFVKTAVPAVTAWLQAAATLLERNGGAILLQIASQVAPDIATGQWGALTATIIADAKTAGASLIAEEEQLAASTALQLAQTAGKVLNPPVVAADPVDAAPVTVAAETTA